MTLAPHPILDCPPSQLPEPQELIEAAMQWHFSPETGSAFWLERAKSLDFDPRRDVHSWSDLRRFPNVVNELRHVRAEDLVPRGYGPNAPLVGIYESGGMTGIPKRVPLLADWLDRWMAWAMRVAEAHKYPRNVNWLMLTPSGPHLVGYLGNAVAHNLGGTVFTVDMDPRWMGKLVSASRDDEVERYFEHLIAQAKCILQTQDIGALTITPPLLARLVGDDELAGLIKHVQLINWGGAYIDSDTLRLYRTDIFPKTRFCGLYGNTVVLGGAAERADPADDGQCIFDPFSPYISCSVIDPVTGQEVPYGERGRILLHHVSKSMFMPNNLDRDRATRIRPPSGHLGDSIADIVPVPSADNGDFR